MSTLAFNPMAFPGLSLSDKISFVANLPRMAASTPANILAHVGRFYNVQVPQLLSRDRTKDIAFARHMACKLIYEHCELTQQQVAAIFHRDRTTVIFAVNTMNDLLSYHKQIQADYKALLESIKADEEAAAYES